MAPSLHYGAGMSKDQASNRFDVLQVPAFPRRLRFAPGQWLLIPVLLAIPVLALKRTFGESRETSSVSVRDFDLSVEYPKRLRYGEIEEISITVQNKSRRPAQGVMLEVSPGYLEQFSRIQFNPPSVESSNRVRLDYMEPGESRSVHLSLRGKSYGKHLGEIMVAGEGTAAARAPVESFVFP